MLVEMRTYTFIPGAIAKFMARFVDNANLMAGERLPRCYNFKWLGVIWLGRFGNSIAAKLIIVHAIDQRRTSGWRKR